MKIIRPEQPEIKKPTQLSLNNTLFIEGKEIKPLDEKAIKVQFPKKPETMEEVMDSVIWEYTDKVEFKIALTKKQYEIYTEKGGICWLKKQLVKKKKKSKKR